jgi:hypothetical protein
MTNADLTIRVRGDITQASRALGQLGSQLNGLNRTAGTFGRFSGLGGGLLGLGGTAAIAGVLGKATQASMEFNDAFADVVRTVNDSAKVGGFGALKNDIIELSKHIPVAAKELATIAAEGGQMNVPADQLMDFTRVVAELGKTTALTSDQAAEGLGKLANVTGEHNWEKLASEIVAVGNVNVGGVAELLDVAQRIALVGHQIGLGVPEILAIGGALNDAGIDAEMGGSAVSRIFLQMQQSVFASSRGIVASAKEIRDATQRTGDLGENLAIAEQSRSELFTRRGRLKRGVGQSTLMSADVQIARLKREQADAQQDLTDLQHPGEKELAAFAEMAGQTSEQFQTEFRFSPFNAFQDILRGLHGRPAEDQSRLLDQAGINNIRDIESLAGLAGNPEHLGELFGVGAGQANDPTALGLNAAAKWNTDMAHQQLVLNDLSAKAIELGDKLAPAMVDAEQRTLEMVGHLSESSSLFNGIVANLDSITPLLVGVSTLNAVGGLASVAGLFGRGAGAVAGAGGAVAEGVGGAAAGLGLGGAGALGVLLAGFGITNFDNVKFAYDAYRNAVDKAEGANGGPLPVPTLNLNGDIVIQAKENTQATIDAAVERFRKELTAAYAAATRSPGVSRQLGGSYGGGPAALLEP